MILKKQKTYKELSQSGLLIPTEFLDFRADGNQIPMAKIEAMRDDSFQKMLDKVRALGFRLFVKRAVIGGKKHVRVRPRFDNWSVSGTIQIISPDISLDVLNKLFEIAGRVGLGDWRPGCKTPGPYGMFEATLKKG